jgi:hypothetical protein
MSRRKGSGASMRAVALVVLCLAVWGFRGAAAAPVGYPTEALADYVFGCMASNGQTPDALRRCSCSIDYIATRISYYEYVQAETVLRVQQAPGGDPRIGMYRSSPWAQAIIDKLRNAQVEADNKCF